MPVYDGNDPRNSDRCSDRSRDRSREENKPLQRSISINN
jgi:hypothetical protein